MGKTILLGLVLGLAVITLQPATASAVVSRSDAHRSAHSIDGGADDDAAERRGSCGDWRRATSGVTKWRVSTSDCFVFGSKGFKIGYDWALDGISDTKICVQGRGWHWSDAKQKRVARWYKLGCGTDNSYCEDPTYCSLPWGNVSAYPKVRAKSQPGMLGGAYRWRH